VELVGLDCPMQSRTEHGDRTASAVESWIDNKLIVHRSVDAVPDFTIVVDLQNFFPSIVEGDGSTFWAYSGRAHAAIQRDVSGCNDAFEGRARDWEEGGQYRPTLGFLSSDRVFLALS